MRHIQVLMFIMVFLPVSLLFDVFWVCFWLQSIFSVKTRVLNKHESLQNTTHVIDHVIVKNMYLYT